MLGVIERTITNRICSMETPNTLQGNIEAEALPDTLMPSEIRSVFPAGQFILMLLAACYFAGEIILPIVLAFVLNLVLQPLMRPLEKLHLPRSLAALAIIMVLGGSIIGIGAALSGPADFVGPKTAGGPSEAAGAFELSEAANRYATEISAPGRGADAGDRASGFNRCGSGLRVER